MIAEIYAHQNPFICQLLMDVTPENNAKRVKLLRESGCKSGWQGTKDVFKAEVGTHSGKAS
jgi:hypothetical protein